MLQALIRTLLKTRTERRRPELAARRDHSGRKGAPSCAGFTAKGAWPGSQSAQGKSAQGRHTLESSYPEAN